MDAEFNVNVPKEIVESLNYALAYYKPFYHLKISKKHLKAKDKFLTKQLEKIKELAIVLQNKSDLSDEDLYQIAQYDFMTALFLKWVRRNEVLDMTLDNLKKEEIIMSDLDESFLLEFYKHVEETGSASKRQRWAKILTEKIKDKNLKIGYRTLSTFNHMSDDEVEVLSILFKNIIGDFVLSDIQSTTNVYGVSDEDIRNLIDIGIINPISYNQSLTSNQKNKERFVFNFPITDSIKAVVSSSNQKITYSIHLLTSVGKELLGIKELFTNRVDKDHFDRWAIQFNKMNMTLHQYQRYGTMKFSGRIGSFNLIVKFDTDGNVIPN